MAQRMRRDRLGKAGETMGLLTSVRIPMKPPTCSEMMPPGNSEMIPAGIPE
jgi:hypothetical protein